jgi:aminoglycoside phosphotransferase (APT) family kinase protein
MALNDTATDIRPGEALDSVRIDAWLKDHLPDVQGTPRIRQFPGGASNLTYLIQYPQRELVLRRPPFGHKARSAHDMGREFRILNQLRPAFAYCPQAWLHCADENVIGAEFYLMERVEGIILRTDLPGELNFDAQRSRRLCERFIDRLVELHQVDYNACGLGDLGKPEGYVQRQVSGWSERYDQARTPDAPAWDTVEAWLRDKQPADSGRTSLLHNDYRFDNVILDAADPLRIIGVLDWELATLGDPLMDLGNSLAYWIEANDPAPVQLMRRQPSNAAGMLSREAFVAYYAQRAGISVSNMDFYRVYGLFRLAGIIQQIYFRFYHGQTSDPRFAPFIHLNGLLERMSLQVIERSRL